MGVCGTDIEIVQGEYGTAPPGADRLILGHESLGEVVEAPPGSGLTPGQHVAGIVRQPDPVPCASCAVGEWDMCRNGQYTEHGIKGLHGFGADYFRVEPALRRAGRSRARAGGRPGRTHERRGEGVGAHRADCRARRVAAVTRARHRCRAHRAARRAAGAPAGVRGARPRQGHGRARSPISCATSARSTTRAASRRRGAGATSQSSAPASATWSCRSCTCSSLPASRA